MIYDIAIIGGGIAGAGIARDASLRGARVILFEKNTFGSGTSSKSSRLIHGGLRYLETAWRALKRGHFPEFWKNLRFVFLALRETAILQNTAPEQIHPLQLILPVYRHTGRNPWAVYAGALLYGGLAKWAGGPHTSKILSTKMLLRMMPSLNPEGLAGGALVWDHTTEDISLVNAIMRAAIQAGTQAFEDAAITRYHYSETEKAYQISVLLKGESKTFQARKLINAAGPWVDQVRTLAKENGEPLLAPVAGAHLNLKKFCEYSVILEAEDGRVFFVINRKDYARVGTTERICENPDNPQATLEEIDYLLRSLKKFFPKATFRKDALLSTDAGIRPLARPPKGLSPNDISREHQFVTGPSGVIHVLGVKLTDHRRAAEELIDQLIPELKIWNPAIATQTLTRTSKI